MHVVTLNLKDFDAHAARLAAAVKEGDSTCYDAIVAVRRGGSIVCDAFLRHFPESRYAARYDVSRQRPSTKHKKGGLKKILRLLPYLLLDILRKAEARILSLQRKIKKPSAIADVEIPGDLTDILTQNTNPEILLIDDAIDSGDTLYAISETLRKTNPGTKICIAVMTETTDNPRIRANYTLYRNNTLIRFPWSDDFKTPRKSPSGE